MDKIIAFALGTQAAGEINQIKGAFGAIQELTGDSFDVDDAFLLPADVKSVDDLRRKMLFSEYSSYNKFKADIYGCLDTYMKKSKIIPRIFVVAYSQAENEYAGSNVDAVCRAVKEYYDENKLGFILTSVLTSKLHKYKYVDLVNAPKHLLTLNSRIRYLQHKSIKKRALITVGTINNFSLQKVKQKKEDLMNMIKKYSRNAELKPAVQKLKDFCKAEKRVVFCLGGRVNGSEVIFDVNYAGKLLSDAEKLTRIGYNVVFCNGPRTPNDVTDYLYEKTLNNSKILFQNCKKIAEDDSERTISSWRIYSGRNEEKFKVLEKMGNIYPGVLGFENTLVVHTFDSYSSCETAGAAIPTAISSQGLYIDPNVRYDCHNLQKLLCPKYAIDWDDFVNMACNMKIEPKDLNPLVLSSPLRVFAETCLNRIISMGKRKITKKKIN